LIPVTTAAGIILGFLLTQTVIVEVVFGVPGIGWLLIESVTFKDIPMVQGLALLIATLIIVVNALTDVLYLFIDPRIRYQVSAA
jgi:peptide/nickel transport system permease protein